MYSENIVLYDWLSFTTKKHSPEEIVSALGLMSCPFEVVKGARGYRDRLYFSSISIHFNGRPDMGVWVEMSGQGCRTFETCSSIGWDKLFTLRNLDFVKFSLDIYIACIYLQNSVSYKTVIHSLLFILI